MNKFMYWNNIIQEVGKSHLTTNPMQKFISVNLGFPKNSAEEAAFLTTKRDKPFILRNYKIGGAFGNTYFTKREAECMFLMLQGKSNSKIAGRLKLSTRTVEYYVKNMKLKTGCRTKSELISIILESDFLKNIDFTFD
jgi:DNA-binding CsgD family transcriptional regulator